MTTATKNTNTNTIPVTSKTKIMSSKISKTKLKEQRIANYLAPFATKFEMEDSYIDLRTMAENYPNGVIPNKDVGEAVTAVLGASAIPRLTVDPTKLNVPKFTWAPMDDIGIKPKFQRNVMPSHIGKIEVVFEADTIIVPCAIKDPVSGKFLLWDGHHTTRVCERMGWTHMPVWYTEAQIDDSHSVEEATKILVSHAGNSMITINKTGKKELSLYDAHMIGVECEHSEPVIVQNICDANNVRVRFKSDKAGDISHINHLYGAYGLVQSSSGIKGIYLARALRFFRATWPKEIIQPIVMLSMARLYQHTEMQTGVLLPHAFDDELGTMLKKIYGPAEIVHDEQTGFKAQFIKQFGSLAGHPEVVTSGLILTYNKHGQGGYKLAQPESVYQVQ
jgi:hypothetical protein